MSEHILPPFFYEIFDASLPRLGPGDAASTAKALDLLYPPVLSKAPHDKSRLRVLDLGCGNGAPTVELAKRLNCTIQAVDNHQAFLDELRQRAVAAGVADRITPLLADMRTFAPGDGIYDLIWSEGALSLMGFRDGLAACRRWLAPDGRLAVSELCWFEPDPPPACRAFYAKAYPEMASVEDNLSTIASLGYRDVSHFLLPESCWLDEFYRPLAERLRLLRRQYAEDVDKIEWIERIQEEIDVYETYSSCYGYAFFVMRR